MFAYVVNVVSIWGSFLGSKNCIIGYESNNRYYSIKEMRFSVITKHAIEKLIAEIIF